MVTGLFRHLFTFGSLTGVSRVLGLVRDVVIAAVFGSGAQTDSFIVAFKIPNFMRRITAEGAFSHAFVPVLTEYRRDRSHDEVRALVARIVGVLAVALLVLTTLGVLAAPALVTVFAPGFDGEDGRAALTAELLRITFPYILLISLVACAGAVLQTCNRFAVFALAPVLLNATMIAAALWWTPWFETPITALAVAVPVAGVLQLMLHLPHLYREGLLVLPRPSLRHEGVRRVLRLMGPAVLGNSVMQINLLVDTILASFLVTGSVTWLYFSDRLVEFPLGVFGIALGTVLLPRLSADYSADGNPHAAARFSATLDWGLRLVVLLIAPATAGLVVLAGPTLATLFQYGAFTPGDVQAAAYSLAAYSFGLFGFVLVKVLSPGYFSRQDTRTPVYCAVAAVVVNIVISVSVVLTLRETAYAHAGLAAATATSATTNATLLYIGLRRRGVYQPLSGWARTLSQTAVATAAMALVLAWPATQMDAWIDASVWARAVGLTGCVATGMAVYFAVLWGLGWRPRELREPPGWEPS